jgi:hypothetical protein
MVRECDGVLLQVPLCDVHMINGRVISLALWHMSRFKVLWRLSASVQSSRWHFLQHMSVSRALET